MVDWAMLSFFFFLLFICAYKAWVISPPCPHPLPYHLLRPLPLLPTPSIPSRNYFDEFLCRPGLRLSSAHQPHFTMGARKKWFWGLWVVVQWPWFLWQH
jgi:hypothetical protein